MLLKEIQHALRDRVVTVVAKETGIHEHTIHGIKNGGGNPTYKTLKTLADYLGVKA